MRSAPFTRSTIIAAVELLEEHSQARFNQMVLRLGLEDEISSSTAFSVTKKCDLLGRVVVRRPTTVLETTEGTMTLAEGVVREAVQLAQRDSTLAIQTAFAHGLARDGYVLSWDEYERSPTLRAALPNEIDLPATDDEVHQLLKAFDFQTPLGHLGQAIDAHTRGDCAAANGQLRTFLESLFDDIARSARPAKAALRPTSENRRALLAEIEFLAVDRNEWTPDGKNYINGLFKMLHTAGSHPGLSDEDHCTFRLHVVLVTARTSCVGSITASSRSDSLTALCPRLAVFHADHGVERSQLCLISGGVGQLRRPLIAAGPMLDTAAPDRSLGIDDDIEAVIRVQELVSCRGGAPCPL